MVNYSSLIEKLLGILIISSQLLPDETLDGMQDMSVKARCFQRQNRHAYHADSRRYSNRRTWPGRAQNFLSSAVDQRIHLPWQRLFEIGFNTVVILP